MMPGSGNDTFEHNYNMNIQSASGQGAQFNTPYIHPILVVAVSLVVVLSVIVIFLIKINRANNKAYRDLEKGKTESAPVSRQLSFDTKQRLYGSVDNLDLPELKSRNNNSNNEKSASSPVLEFSTKFDFLNQLLHLQKLRVSIPKPNKAKKSEERSYYLEIEFKTVDKSDLTLKQHKMQLDLATTNKGIEIYNSGEVASILVPKKLKLYNQMIFLSLHEVKNGSQDLSHVESLGEERISMDEIDETEKKFCLILSKDYKEKPKNIKVSLDLTYKPASVTSTLLLHLHEVFYVPTKSSQDSNEETHQIFVSISRVVKNHFVSIGLVSSSMQKGTSSVYVLDEGVSIQLENACARTQSLCLEVLLARGEHTAETLGVIRLGNFTTASWSGLNHWKLAVENSNSTIHMAHACTDY